MNTPKGLNTVAQGKKTRASGEDFRHPGFKIVSNSRSWKNVAYQRKHPKTEIIRGLFRPRLDSAL